MSQELWIGPMSDFRYKIVVIKNDEAARVRLCRTGKSCEGKEEIDDRKIRESQRSQQK